MVEELPDAEDVSDYNELDLMSYAEFEKENFKTVKGLHYLNKEGLQRYKALRRQLAQ